jgi:cytochrome c oxidase cbb3-type subunit 3
MRSIHSINKKFFLSLTALFCITSLMGQNTTGPVEKTVTSSNNLLVYLLVTMSIVLAFVIWGLGQALVTLSRQVVDKHKRSSKIFTTVLLIGFMLLSQILQAQNGEESVKILPNYGGLSSETFYFFVTVISIEIITILFLALSVRSMYSSLLPDREPAPAKVFALKKWWARIDKKIFTNATPVEKEADILLDHNYDGIQELDNALPPWWKYGFYLTIGVAVIYLLNFHVFGTGKNPTQEYDAEIAKARIEKEIYESKNKDKIDENNVPMADAAGLATAKGIFTTQCFACHGKLGEGGAGPNLTDDYWLHKGSLNDVYHTIKNGYPEKGMQSWAAVFSPKEISFLASYVKSLRGTKPPNAKAPQGDLETEISPSSSPADSVRLIKTE